MARPQVADGGDALQIWRVAVNILNKQSRTADRGWELTTPDRKTSDLLRNIAEGFGPKRRIHLAQDRDRWRAVVNAVMNLRVLVPRN
jgi:hypothetical protein